MDGRQLPLVACASLGGTITMVPAGGGAITPALTADDLVASVPGLGAVARIRAATLATLPSASLDERSVAEAVRWARDEVDAGASGAVVAQGTDTLEETAWLAELLWDRPEPLVFTGAMRGAAQPSADGPANLLDAARVVAEPSVRGLGVLVVLDASVHHASLVRKAHTTALSAFRSFGCGTLGQLSEGAVVVREFRRPAAPLAVPDAVSARWVPLWTTHLGDDGRGVRALLDRHPAGLVVAGFGAGHVSFGLSDVLADAAARIPVVITTRIAEGGAKRRTYGFQGSEVDLQRRGVIVGGDLDGLKSRVLLQVLVDSGVGRDEIARQFEARGTAR